MNDDDKKHQDQFDAALPLPASGSSKPQKSDDKPDVNPAADLIRKKVAEAYTDEPSIKLEQQIAGEHADAHHPSKHQQFILELTNSGKPLHEVQMAWHEYYAALPDKEKHEVWQEFYKAHAEASPYPLTSTHKKQTHSVKIKALLPAERRPKRTATHMPKPLDYSGVSHTSSARPNPFRSLIFGLGIGAIVLVIFLFSFFNERFIAPFIQPSRNSTNTPIISDTTKISKAPEIIIPKINVQIPVVYNVDTINDAVVETALENGVVHYADTALPGHDGNVVIVGHSSNNIFNPGKYKFAFVLLHKLDNGDTFYLDKNGKRYTYEVYKKEIVSPTDVSVLGSTDKPATATLITCDPPGTSNNRLVVVGEQISPNPSGNKSQSTDNKLATQSAIIPGNSPSLWSRVVKWLWD